MEPEWSVGAALEAADDAFVVGRAVDGDLRAFTVLLRRHSAVLRRYITRITRNNADTDEVLQDVSVIAWKQLASLREREQVLPWLIRIATREAIRHVNSAPQHLEVNENDAVLPGPDSGIDRLDLDQALRTALDALPQQQAQVWTLRELGGYSYEEIAAEMGLPLSTVRGSLAQARKRLLAMMGGAR